MKKLYMALGLPASGKTTKAREMQASDPNLVRINKDDLRALLHNSKWSRENEKQIISIRNNIIEDSLSRGKNVIVDDTNFGKHEARLRQLAQQHKAEFEILDFTDVPLEECLRRNLKRCNSVPEKVIKDMYNKYLRKDTGPLNPVVFNKSLPYCVIFDLDGCIAHINGRSPYDGKSCASDLPNTSIIALAHLINGSTGLAGWESIERKMIIFSGRNGDSKEETKKWLEQNLVHYDELHMREPGDMRKDSIVKKEMFDKYIRDKYNVLFIVDDRKQVKRMWVDMGITVLDVNQHDIEF